MIEKLASQLPAAAMPWPDPATAAAVAPVPPVDSAEPSAPQPAQPAEPAEADLRDADLSGLPLAGIRWSRATRWPPAWVEQTSVEVEPGIFEIRGGTTSTDTSTVLSGV